MKKNKWYTISVFIIICVLLNLAGKCIAGYFRLPPLRDMVDKVRDKAPNAVTVLIGSDGSKTMMAVGVSKNAQARGLKAGALVKKIATIAGGNGGGKPDFAMAGIRDTSKIDDALNAVPEIVKAEMQ